MDVAFLPGRCLCQHKNDDTTSELFPLFPKTVDSVAFTKLIDTRRAYIFPFFGNNKKIVGIL